MNESAHQALSNQRPSAGKRVVGADMKNLGTIERVLRIALGGALAIWALVLFLGGSPGLIWQLLDVALIALGVDFVVTGIRGYCPLYKRLGWSTAQQEAHG
jgi:hypothetical protein